MFDKTKFTTELDYDFENGQYFKYLKLNDVKSRLQRNQSNQDKINGKF